MTNGKANAGGADTGDGTFGFGEALRREYVSLWPDRDDDGNPVAFANADAYLRRVLADRHQRQSALCLSGGGIRSAAFCLGIIQSLAAKGLLSRFHYVSAVSGGGYIGAWLQSCLLAHARGRADFDGHINDADVKEVQEQLAGLIAPNGPVDLLRGFTSYLTPQPGLASPDTWAGIVLWTRNILVNWAVFGPALFALAMLPLVYRDFLAWLPDRGAWVALAVALAAVGASAFGACAGLPSHWPPPNRRPPAEQEVAAIRNRIALPSWVWAATLPLAVAPALPLVHGAAPWVLTTAVFGVTLGPAGVVAGATFVVLLIAYGFAWLRAKRQNLGSRLFLQNLLAWIIACAVACAVLGAGVQLGRNAVATIASPTDAAWIAVCGPIWAMGAHLSLSAVFVALRRTARRGDLDREWLARLSGLKVVPILLASVLMAVCLILPGWLLSTNVSQLGTWVTGAFTTASGIVAAVFGNSAKTPFTSPGGGGWLSAQAAAGVATLVFAVGLFVLLATAGQGAIVALPLYLPFLKGVASWVVALLLAAASFALAWWLGHQVNVNRFSLHNIYRNRLARAFIGSGRGGAGDATRDPFTKFDPEDNPRLHTLAPAVGEARMLFPVIGTSLNLISGVQRKWAERKAAPFTMTPVACGSESLKARTGREEGRFIDPQDYGGAEHETGQAGEAMGITLGTAMAVSGAAVSPSMGYHSSPATSFLMTLFNVRLGIWLPNLGTAAASTFKYAQPPNALWSLINEMLGRVGDRGSSIYLSDGGHFDNLGLYEMVRRGCRLIVVVDAGEDRDLRYSDLGDALRKIRIDQQVEITFPSPLPIAREADWTDRCRPFMLGRIVWNTPVRTTGRLLYIKPSLFDGLPVDLRAYARTDPTFPNDTTLDQFFTESKFESYRKLGQYIGEKLNDAEYAGAAIGEVLEELLGHQAVPDA